MADPPVTSHPVKHISALSRSRILTFKYLSSNGHLHPHPALSQGKVYLMLAVATGVVNGRLMRRAEVSGLYEGDPAHDGTAADTFEHVHHVVANSSRTRRASSCSSPKRKAPITFGEHAIGRCHINYDMYVLHRIWYTPLRPELFSAEVLALPTTLGVFISAATESRVEIPAQLTSGTNPLSFVYVGAGFLDICL